ncbi:PorT family protein [Flavobacterium sp. CYK-55]|uniref:type IX secretion/gliding motility protein PorT/SprT n=1 Tax=Flavobacterium sp. CYK-55 TaxID=2835529 RepID=UPI001BCFD68D|nr:porin family protein [Flavobacterium sp. CYK-55]MBS7785857.1 PorT family protein [Flavobacterium sp. CYK-55]
MKHKIVWFFAFLMLSAQAQKAKRVFGKDPLVNLENFDKQRVYWGYYLGFNSYDFKFDYKVNAPDIEVKRTTGFNVGLVGDLRLTDYINIRFEPGLYYTKRNLTYTTLTKPVDRDREVNSTYIHLPLLLKFSSVRTGNIRPYLVGGFSTTSNLASNQKSKDDNTQQKFRMKQWTQNYEVGFGIDLYLEYFKFSPSIRGVFGMNDELVRDNDPNSPWTGNINSMKTRAILVNFTFH